LRKAERAVVTPDQLVLTPEQHAAWVKKLYGEAVGKGIINDAFLAGHTNLAEIAAQIKSPSSDREKGATLLMRSSTESTAETGKNAASEPESRLAPVTDPMEILLLASLPVTDNDFEALAAERAKAVRTYLLSTGKVEAERVFLTQSQTGGVRTDGSRAYLQFQ